MNALPSFGSPFLLCALGEALLGEALLGEALLGVPALAVREILPLPEITRVQGASLYAPAREVVNVRGRLVPVVDISALLGVAPTRADINHSLLLLERAGKFLAFVVEEVRDVLPLQTQLKPGAEERNSGALVKYLAPIGDEIAQILELETLFDFAAPALQAPALQAPALAPNSEAIDFSRAPLFELTSDERAILRERAQLLSRPSEQIESETGADTEKIELAAVALGGEFFGMELSVVREFSPLRSLARVPGNSLLIAGVMNLRGETLTLLDVRAALGLSLESPVVDSTSRNAWSGEALPGEALPGEALPRKALRDVVVVECDGIRAGILVDEVLDVWSVPASQITPPPPNLRAAGQVLSGALVTRDIMISILDVARLLQSES